MRHSEGFQKLVEEARARIREVTPDEAHSRISSSGAGKLIDIREDHEWQAGRAAGAEHLGKGILERDIEERFPDKQTELILYCGGGYRSALSAEVLQRMGYENVFSMAGGWRAWKESGLPVSGESSNPE